jgi:hypothetical protein
MVKSIGGVGVDDDAAGGAVAGAAGDWAGGGGGGTLGFTCCADRDRDPASKATPKMMYGSRFMWCAV